MTKFEKYFQCNISSSIRLLISEEWSTMYLSSENKNHLTFWGRRVCNLVPDFMNFSSKKKGTTHPDTQNVDMCFHLFLGWTEEKKQFEIAIEIRFIFCEDKCKKKGEGKKGKGKVQFASVLNVEVLVESIRKRNNYLIESLVTLFLFFNLRYNLCILYSLFFKKNIVFCYYFLNVDS